MTAVSRDGGKTWKLGFAHLSRCSGGTPSNGGYYQRVTDPWVTIAPDGTVFESGLSTDESDPNSALLVVRSTDGGDTWSEPTSLVINTDTTILNDKDSITADPHNPGYVYAIWTHLVFADPQLQNLLSSQVWLSRTKDGGNTWEAPRDIYDAPPGFTANDHQIVVLPDGMLVDMFEQWDNSSASYYCIRSSDLGLTWSQPILIDVADDPGVIDVETGAPIHSGVAIISANPTTGALYLVWQDARFSGGARDGIALSSSTDGGVTWSPAVQVNQAPNVQAFAPSVAVAANGRIAITYYDFRNDTPDLNTLFTTYWRVTSEDGGKTWNEISLIAPFDLLIAPKSGRGRMITDYEGLAPIGENFLAFFVATNTGNTSNPTDVFTISTEQGVGTSAVANGRTEINFHPLTKAEQMRSEEETMKSRSRIPP
jgi:Neuraminidase (sialidase)